MRMKVSRRLSTGATVLALLAIPPIASAHGGNSDQNVVHACIGNVSKVVRVVGVSGTCLSSPPLIAETPAHLAGSFRMRAHGLLVFRGTVDGTRLGAALTRLPGGRWGFAAIGAGAERTGVRNPVLVGLQIGDDAGSTDVPVRIRTGM